MFCIDKTREGEIIWRMGVMVFLHRFYFTVCDVHSFLTVGFQHICWYDLSLALWISLIKRILKLVFYKTLNYWPIWTQYLSDLWNKKKEKLSLRFVPTNLYNNAFDNNSRAPSILRNAESKLNQSYPKTRAHFSAKSTLSVHVSLGYVHGCLNLEEENKK